MLSKCGSSNEELYLVVSDAATTYSRCPPYLLVELACFV